MSDPEPPVSLDIIQFDQALIDAWFEISPTTNIEIGVPRVAFDALYDGVHKGYSAQLDIVTALQILHSTSHTTLRRSTRMSFQNWLRV
jgi:hypothetical protein